MPFSYHVFTYIFEKEELFLQENIENIFYQNEIKN